MKDFEDMSLEELEKEYDRLYFDLCNGIGDSKDNLIILLALERQLTIEEYCPKIRRRKNEKQIK